MKNAAWISFGVLCFSLLAIAPPAVAQDTYPSLPIKLIYGYAAGGGGDTLARLLATKLSAQMNANVIVDNKPGASGNIGNEFVAKSKPDGYTLLFNDAGVILNPMLGGKANYDVFKDLVPVSLVVTQPFALIVHPSVPSNTPAEFITYLRANPNKLAYASPGIGTSSHLSALLFLQLNGLSALHVPYKGAALLMLDVVAGRVQWVVTAMQIAVPMAKEKRVKMLAYGGLKRSPLLPDVPTFAEAVMPGFEVGTWKGVMVPAQTPPAIVNRLNGETVKALQDPDMKSRLALEGAEPSGSTPEAFSAYLRSELERWTKVIKSAGVKVE